MSSQPQPSATSAQSTDSAATFPHLNFSNSVLHELPLDRLNSREVRDPVSGVCYATVPPTPSENPKLVCASPSALSLCGIPQSAISSPEFVSYFSGNSVIPGSETASHCGQLGDGAAIYLGEITNPDGSHIEMQLKGAGMTPFSRQADGRKVLRSSIREFLCSEHMHALNIPTTRAGAIITSDTKVIRDVFYSGNPIEEKSSIVLRICPTFIRFGSFEIFKSTDAFTGRSGPSVGQLDLKRQLLEYVIRHFYDSIWTSHGQIGGHDCYAAFFKEIVRRTASLVAGWQAVGFVHGVLNTDNMSIIGVTIDYGPFGFLERFDPNLIVNSSDDGGRYVYSKQPEICKWNCLKLAEALDPLLPLERGKQIVNDEYDTAFTDEYDRWFRAKLGLSHDKVLPTDRQLVEDLLDVMQSTGTDFTNAFRALTRIAPGDDQDNEAVVQYMVSQCASVETMTQALRPTFPVDQLLQLAAIIEQNPTALERFGIDPHVITRQMQQLERFKAYAAISPQQKTKRDTQLWQIWIQKYAHRLVQESNNHLRDTRLTLQRTHCPRYILRNWIAQTTIERAQRGDNQEIERAFNVLTHPYHDFEGNDSPSHVALQQAICALADTPTEAASMACKLVIDPSINTHYDEALPWGHAIRVSCSS